MLTGEAGLVRATIFGGPKSRLRSHASQCHSGTAYVYHDPVKDSRKLSDFDVAAWRPGLRELYERAMAADAVCETVLASHGGGGNWKTALALSEAALDALAEAPDDACPRIVLWFFWQWVDFLGLRPDFSHCCLCGKALGPESEMRHSALEGGFICAACTQGARGGLTEAGGGFRHWLETVRPLSPGQLCRCTLDKKSAGEARAISTAILAEAVGRRLESWNCF
jgi:DNA repair protein RecO (recombination protein O)